MVFSGFFFFTKNIYKYFFILNIFKTRKKIKPQITKIQMRICTYFEDLPEKLKYTISSG